QSFCGSRSSKRTSRWGIGGSPARRRIVGGAAFSRNCAAHPANAAAERSCERGSMKAKRHILAFASAVIAALFLTLTVHAAEEGGAAGGETATKIFHWI